MLKLQIAWDIKTGWGLDKQFARCHILGNSSKFCAGVCQLQHSGELIEKPELLLKGSFLPLELQIAQSTLSAADFADPSPVGNLGQQAQSNICIYVWIYQSLQALGHLTEKFGMNESSYTCKRMPSTEGFCHSGESRQLCGLFVSL